ncbi:hypothetical protein BJY04DRAFT_201266 [Aspergillus karnatakaensis]|uniref:uncharacterized protein n=1 Tax=Aspergillus karnatakaensis TaxID=1810916 RepID=UPI003CCDB0D8
MFNEQPTPAPILAILCGRTEKIASVVIPALLPEIEVIHFIPTTSSAVSQIPALLRGETAVPSDTPFGTKNYTRGVGAIILGAGYTDEDIDAMRAVSVGEGSKGVPWIRADTSKPTPPLGPEYGKDAVRRVKAAFEEIQDKGGLEGDGVFWY